MYRKKKQRKENEGLYHAEVSFNLDVYSVLNFLLKLDGQKKFFRDLSDADLTGIADLPQTETLIY